LFDDCGMFLRASREFISETLQPGAPLTQTDMNIAAAAKLGEAEQQLAAVLSSLGQPSLPERIECANARWLEFAEAWVAVRVGEREQGGTIWPLHYAGVKEKMVNDWRAELERYRDRGEGEV
jgi:hypothetical protein